MDKSKYPVDNVILSLLFKTYQLASDLSAVE